MPAILDRSSRKLEEALSTVQLFEDHVAMNMCAIFDTSLVYTTQNAETSALTIDGCHTKKVRLNTVHAVRPVEWTLLEPRGV